MTWTTDRPTTPGWYWRRHVYGRKVRRVIVTMIEVKQWKWEPHTLFIYAGKPIERCCGQWAGPIPLPEDGPLEVPE